MSSWVTDMVLDSVPCAVDNVIVPVRVHFFSTRWNIRSLNRSYHLLSLLLRQNEATAELYIDRYCNYSHWALIYPPISYNVANINNWTKYNNIFWLCHYMFCCYEEGKCTIYLLCHCMLYISVSSLYSLCLFWEMLTVVIQLIKQFWFVLHLSAFCLLMSVFVCLVCVSQQLTETLPQNPNPKER